MKKIVSVIIIALVMGLAFNVGAKTVAKKHQTTAVTIVKGHTYFGSKIITASSPSVSIRGDLELAFDKNENTVITTMWMYYQGSRISAGSVESPYSVKNGIIYVSADGEFPGFVIHVSNNNKTLTLEKAVVNTGNKSIVFKGKLTKTE